MLGEPADWRLGSMYVMLVAVKKVSLAQAKAHFSELVDRAQHTGKRTLILRHGKPAAVIVPVDVAIPESPRARRPMGSKATRRSVEDFIAEFSAVEPAVSAVEDLLAGRR